MTQTTHAMTAALGGQVGTPVITLTSQCQGHPPTSLCDAAEGHSENCCIPVRLCQEGCWRGAHSCRRRRRGCVPAQPRATSHPQEHCSPTPAKLPTQPMALRSLDMLPVRTGPTSLPSSETLRGLLKLGGQRLGQRFLSVLPALGAKLHPAGATSSWYSVSPTCLFIPLIPGKQFLMLKSISQNDV